MIRTEIEKKYRSGKLPAFIWFWSSLAGAIVASVALVTLRYEHFDADLIVGFFRTIIGNMLWTIPVFALQAHYVCKALMSETRKERMVLAIVLLIGLIYGIVLLIYKEGAIEMNFSETKCFQWVDFGAITSCWTLLSVISIRGKK